MESYRHIPAIIPEMGTNIANRTKRRKGSIEEGFRGSDFIIEEVFSFLPGDHVAMEPRITIAEITAQGQVIIRSATQAPFVVRALMADFFGIDPGKITVIAPLGIS
jgi:CO/xanthine dehydrogenase Mo-binding subunit